MSLLRLHAQITIPLGTEAQARQFYRVLLGLPEVSKPAVLQGRGGLWVQVGEQQIHIGMEAGVERAHTKAHLAYEAENLALWRERLQAHGIVLLEGIPIPGFKRFEFRDPFGNRGEFIKPIG